MATKLVHSSSAAKLYVEYTSTQNINTNKSSLTLSMYVTPTSGWSIGPWTDGSGSYLGDAKTDTFTKSISEISKKTVLRTTTFDVEHDSDGTKKLTIYWKWGVNSSWGGFVRPSGSFEIELPTIPRAAELTSFTSVSEYLGESMIVGYDCKNTSFKHKVRYYTKGTTIYSNDITPTATGAQTCGHDFNADQLAEIYKLYPNDVTTSISVLIETYNGETKIGESSPKAIELKIPETVIPTVSAPSISDAAGLTDTFGGYVQNKSSAKVAITAAGVHGSSITKYETVINGVKYTTQSFTSLLKTAGTFSITTTVEDSRGRTATSEATEITVYPYYNPKLTNVSIYRCVKNGDVYVEDDEGTYACFKFGYDIAPVNDKNTKSVKLQYLNNGVWTDITTITNSYSNNNVEFYSGDIFSNDTSYEVRILPNDYFITDESLSIVKTLSTAFVLINLHDSGTGLAFGKVAEYPDVIESGLPIRFTGGIDTIEIPENQDLNNYIIPGFYRCPLVATVKTLANTPTTNAFHLYVGEHAGSNSVCQFLVQYVADTPTIWVRNKYLTTWGSWYKMYTTKDTIFDGNAKTATSATKATQDGNGAVIANTYAKCPVGTVVITSSNSAPSNVGTWTLIDKEYKPQTIVPVPFTLNTTNCKDTYIEASLAGHNVAVKIGITNKVAIGETELPFGTINLNSIGIQNGLPFSYSCILGISDGGNVWTAWAVSATGALSSVDADAASSSLAASKYTYIYFEITMSVIANMIDSFCNKFYWKRTA